MIQWTVNGEILDENACTETGKRMRDEGKIPTGEERRGLYGVPTQYSETPNLK